MKRTLMAAALSAGLLIGGTAEGLPESTQHPSAAHLHPVAARKASGEWRWRQCRFQGLQPGAWTPREERLTTSCVLGRWQVTGGRAKFDAVISCESGWNRLAYNPSGPYLGLGQHAATYWLGRVRAYTPPRWSLPTNWRNSRSQITVTARMVRRGGWGPWSCA